MLALVKRFSLSFRGISNEGNQSLMASAPGSRRWGRSSRPSRGESNPCAPGAPSRWQPARQQRALQERKRFVHKHVTRGGRSNLGQKLKRSGANAIELLKVSLY